MLDSDAYDQYCVVTGEGSSVQIWLNSAPDPTKLEERPVRSLWFIFCCVLFIICQVILAILSINKNSVLILVYQSDT